MRDDLGCRKKKQTKQAVRLMVRPPQYAPPPASGDEQPPTALRLVTPLLDDAGCRTPFIYEVWSS